MKSRNIFRKTVYLMALFSLVLLFGNSMSANAETKAEPVKVTGVKQARWFTNTGRVLAVWDKQNVSGYEYVFMDQNGKELSKGFTAKNYYEHNVNNANYYFIKVRAIGVVNGKMATADYSDTACLFAQPMMVSVNYGDSYKVSVKNGKMYLKWKKTKTASGYRIYISRKRDSGYKLVKTIKNRKKNDAVITRFKHKSFKTNKKYYVYVQAIRKYQGRTYTSGVNYVWKYKNGKVKQTNYYGKY